MKLETKKGKVPTKPPEPQGGPDDAAKMRRLLAPLMKDIGARFVVLVDMNGEPIAQHGQPGRLDLRALAPLMAGSCATMRYIANHFGGEFAVLVHHGRRENVQVSLVGDRAILAIVFGNEAPLGTARLCAAHVTKKLEGLFAKMGVRPRGRLGPEFAEAVKARLDELLGS